MFPSVFILVSFHSDVTRYNQFEKILARLQIQPSNFTENNNKMR